MYMTNKIQKTFLLGLSVFFCFFLISDVLAVCGVDEFCGSLDTGVNTGMDVTTQNCATVANGTVAPDYPTCTLTCNTGYTKNGNICEASGGGGGGGGGGAPQGDVTAPSISDISIIKTDTTATINWKTTEASWTWLLWGTTVSYGQENKTEVFVLTHSVSLTGLTPSTTYYFQIKTKDAAGNTLYGNGLSFTTSAQGSTTPVTVTPAGQSSGLQMPILTKPLNQMNRAELINYLVNLIIYLIRIGRFHF